MLRKNFKTASIASFLVISLIISSVIFNQKNEKADDNIIYSEPDENIVQTPEPVDTNSLYLETADNDTLNTESSESDVYMYTQTTGDFAGTYKDFDYLLSCAEVIVSGTALSTNSFMHNNLMRTEVVFEINTTYKGDISGTVTVITYGGKMKYSDYLDVSRGYLEAKLSTETFEEEKKLHGDKYVESIFLGVPNIEVGDDLLLCLTKYFDDSDFDKNGCYFILGSPRTGQFKYDMQNDEFIRELYGSELTDIQKIKNVEFKKELTFTENDLKVKLNELTDISAIHLEENLQTLKLARSQME